MRREERHLEILPVTLSAAKGLARRTQRSFAALRMTTRTPPKSAHGKSYLHMSNERTGMTDTTYHHRSCQPAPLEPGIPLFHHLPQAGSLQPHPLRPTPAPLPHPLPSP